MSNKVKSKKYWDTLTAARELFWKHGFRRVTIQEVCDKAGVSKMTFYKFFPNKIELAKTVFEHEVDNGMDRINNLISEHASGEEMLKEIILLKVKGTNDISPEFLADFYTDNEPDLKNFVMNKSNEAWTTIIGYWEQLQERGVFRDDVKPEFLLKVQMKIQELLNDEELAGMYDSTQELILEITRFVAYGIAKR